MIGAMSGGMSESLAEQPWLLLHGTVQCSHLISTFRCSYWHRFKEETIPNCFWNWPITLTLIDLHQSCLLLKAVLLMSNNFFYIKKPQNLMYDVSCLNPNLYFPYISPVLLLANPYVWVILLPGCAAVHCRSSYLNSGHPLSTPLQLTLTNTTVLMTVKVCSSSRSSHGVWKRYTVMNS